MKILDDKIEKAYSEKTQIKPVPYCKAYCKIKDAECEIRADLYDMWGESGFCNEYNCYCPEEFVDFSKIQDEVMELKNFEYANSYKFYVDLKTSRDVKDGSVFLFKDVITDEVKGVIALSKDYKKISVFSTEQLKAASKLIENSEIKKSSSFSKWI